MKTVKEWIKKVWRAPLCRTMRKRLKNKNFVILSSNCVGGTLLHDLGLRFEQMYSAGVFVDRRPKQDFGDAEGRFSWMTRTTKPVYTFLNEEGNIGFRVSLVAQTAA